MFVWKDKINENEAGFGPFFNWQIRKLMDSRKQTLMQSGR